MDARDFVLLSMPAMGGEIQGKTKFQETVYFPGLMTGRLEELGFRAHFYGPYSDEVSDAIGWMRTIGAVDQTSSSIGAMDNSGFEVRRYDYRLNEEGRQFAGATARRHPELWETLEEAAELLGRAGEVDYVKMSIAAKTYFMLEQATGPAGETDLARLATRFGWEVTPDQVREAAEYLGRLRLLQFTPGS